MPWLHFASATCDRPCIGSLTFRAHVGFAQRRGSGRSPDARARTVHSPHSGPRSCGVWGRAPEGTCSGGAWAKPQNRHDERLWRRRRAARARPWRERKLTRRGVFRARTGIYPCAPRTAPCARPRSVDRTSASSACSFARFDLGQRGAGTAAATSMCFLIRAGSGERSAQAAVRTERASLQHDLPTVA
jgi:hypothetical protein